MKAIYLCGVSSFFSFLLLCCTSSGDDSGNSGLAASIAATYRFDYELMSADGNETVEYRGNMIVREISDKIVEMNMIFLQPVNDGGATGIATILNLLACDIMLSGSPYNVEISHCYRDQVWLHGKLLGDSEIAISGHIDLQEALSPECIMEIVINTQQTSYQVNLTELKL